jgi:Glycosyl transferases group 1
MCSLLPGSFELLWPMTSLSSGPRNILLLHSDEEMSGEFDESFIGGLIACGCSVDYQPVWEPWQKTYEMVLGYGPFTPVQSMLPVARRILEIPLSKRPLFAWWLTENSPDPRWPAMLVDLAARLRIQMDCALEPYSTKLPHFLRSTFFRGHRLRVFGELRWVQQQGVLDVFAVTSAARAAFYHRHGFNPVLAPLGYHPVYGKDLGLNRDIPVAFLGNLDSPRRKRLLPPILRELQQHGIQVDFQTGLYGDERTRYLNRVQVLLTILRAPQDYVGQRFLLGAANKALVVTEPISNEEAFKADKHLVVAGLNSMADIILHYLANPEERKPIVERAYRFVTQELTIQQSVARILEQASRQRDQGRP